MAFSARPTSSNQLTQLVNLAAHGFTVGKLVSFNGSAWHLAQADSLLHSQGTWIVAIVPDVNSFYVTQEGWVNNLPALTSSTQYYLSPITAGTLTTVMPVDVGQVVLPCLVTDTTTSGYFFGGSGYLVGSGSGGIVKYNVVTVDTPMAINQGYITNAAGNVNLLLPPAPVVSDIFKAANYGAGNFTITQNNPNDTQALIGGVPSTAGAGGSVASTNRYSSITGVCVIAAPPTWILTEVVGNYTVV